jgi:hypothetical protein
MRRPYEDEHRKELASRPAPLQPGDDRLADVNGQRQPVGAATLASNDYFTRSPVKVAEP